MGIRKLRDPVHGDIYLTDEEAAAIDTPQMQRLRGIRQLGATYLVYPGAQHSRFEHCLGTCWMARRILRVVESGRDTQLPDLHKRAICLAALVHDVTHIPYGHTFEDERRLLERHDRGRRRFELLLGTGELSDALRGSEAGRLALRVLDPCAPLPDELRYLADVVAGTICADLLDYLRRDNYFCGLKYEFDERVYDYFRVVGGRLAMDIHRGGLLRRDALTEITNLLRIRYVLSERVYYHHAKIAAGVMISKAVERALERGLTEEQLCRLTDDALLHALGERFGHDKALAELLSGYRSRTLFKRCYMVSARIGEGSIPGVVQRYHMNEEGARDEVERRIAEELGTAPHRVAVYCAPREMALKEADVPVTMPDGGMALLSSLNSDEIQVLKNQHRRLWKLYAFVSPKAGDIERAGRICEEIIGFPNELSSERRAGLL
ncbi:MAG: HD domain-containing protein [Candidatus Brocadiia bacterium]